MTIHFAAYTGTAPIEMSSGGRAVRRERGRALRLFIAITALGLAGVLTSGPATAGQAEDRKAFCRTSVDLIQHVLTEGAIPDEDASPEMIQRVEKKLARLLD